MDAIAKRLRVMDGTLDDWFAEVNALKARVASFQAKMAVESREAAKAQRDPAQEAYVRGLKDAGVIPRGAKVIGQVVPADDGPTTAPSTSPPVQNRNIQGIRFPHRDRDK